MKFAWPLSAFALLAAGIASVATSHRAAPARQASPSVATEASRLPVALPERQTPRKTKADPFAQRDSTRRPPPTPVQAAPEQALAPSAPSNPYRFAGTMHYGGSLKAVFIREQHVH